MHSNDTCTTIPTSTIPTNASETSSDPATTRSRLRVLVGGVIAVGALTFGIGAALAQESAAPAPAVGDHAAIADWARSNGLTGLSPASLASVVESDWYGDSAAIADWARSNGLTGLSPASLAPATP